MEKRKQTKQTNSFMSGYFYKAMQSVNPAIYNSEINQGHMEERLDAQNAQHNKEKQLDTQNVQYYNTKYDPKNQTLELESVKPIYEEGLTKTEKGLEYMRGNVQKKFEEIKNNLDVTLEQAQKLLLEAAIYELICGERKLHTGEKTPGRLEK